MHTYSISYSLAYLKYLNKYVLITNVSTYVKYVIHLRVRTIYKDNCTLQIRLWAMDYEYAEQNYLT